MAAENRLGHDSLMATVGATDEGARFDAFLAGCPGVRSRNVAQQIIEAGQADVNGAPKAKNYLLRLGDTVEYLPPEPDAETVDAEDLPLTIVYEDEEIIVIDKAAGMVVHPAAGHYTGTLVNALLSHTRLASPGAPLRPGIVHRLDKGTSGLIVVAKTETAYFSLVAQLKSRQIKREYLALVEGGFKDTSGRIEAPVRRHPQDRKLMTVGGHGAKEAITNFKVLAQAGRWSLLRVNLETGRTHQIRVHMKFIRHPIAGDAAYGNPSLAAPLGLRRPWLHARRLSLIHPVDERELDFSAPVPPELREVLDKLWPEATDWE